MRRPFAAAGGALAAAGPVPIAVASWAHGLHALRGPSWPAVTAALAALCLTAGGLIIHRKPRLGRPLAALGIAGSLVAAAPLLQDAPLLALAVLLGAGAAASSLWASAGLLASALARPPLEHRPAYLFARSGKPAGALDVDRARGASLVAVAFWLIASLAGHAGDTPTQVAVGVAVFIAILLTVRWLARNRARHPVRAAVLLGACALALLGLPFAWGDGEQTLGAIVLVPITAALALPVYQRQGIERVDWWEPILDHPARFLVATFFGLCVAGTVLLALPVSAAGSAGVGLMNAAFTAVSAVCVTGLAVLDTPVAFGPAGELAILVLIQLGGLGIMSFSTAAIRLLGRRMSLRHEGVIAGLVSARDRSRLYSATRRLITFTFAIEGAGALLLTLLFWAHGDAAGQALWRGVFTAVSAFCNAGFALQSTSLMPYQQSPGILHVIALLIIAGSLSPIVAASVPALVRRRPGSVTAQTKIALATTLVLLVAGFLLIAAMEWRNTLADLSVADRLHNAWFQSVTLRTAGFNSIDLAQVRPETLTTMMIWMFIGGNPGGTAGGAKTTTVAVLVLAVMAAIHGRQNAVAFGRRIPHKSVYRAAAITTVGVAVACVALIAVQLTQRMSTPQATFEVVSALGTVGLSIGGTGALDGVGKVIIIACMFMGRVGPLTLFMFLSNRMDRDMWKRPEEDIEVG